MKQKSILIAESGSTKTDWCLVKGGKVKHFKSQGINPYFLSQNDILEILEKELPINPDKEEIDQIVFYGSGIANSEKKTILSKCLRFHFGTRKIEVESDMLAAAQASCQNKPGIAVILGTGSNSCYFDGRRIKDKQISLGYVLGDEGGGNHIGKRVVQYYLYNIMDSELAQSFEETFKFTRDEILEHIYRKPFPNRFLAQFAPFCFKHRGHFMIENILEDCINEFFLTHLIKYKQAFKVPIHFVGSVSYESRDIIEQLCTQYELQLGTITKSPMTGLVEWVRKLK